MYTAEFGLTMQKTDDVLQKKSKSHYFEVKILFFRIFVYKEIECSKSPKILT